MEQEKKGGRKKNNFSWQGARRGKPKHDLALQWGKSGRVQIAHKKDDIIYEQPLITKWPKRGKRGLFFYQRENKEKSQGQRAPQELEFGQLIGPYILVHDNK